ncbi:hypothetical protein FQN54_000553 [Arachnomyces sp. PD_36]|nr:hypothetical protein FQN54_000553 [Arachnomyces sp. PD_36]
MDSPSPMDSPLMSPAKARHAAVQARDWAYVNNWLSQKFSPKPVPPFERNDDTLKTLLALAAFNDSADEEAALVHRAREEAVKGFKAQEVETDPRTELLGDIEASLDDKGAKDLEDLAETAVLLGSINADVREMGQGIIGVTTEEFEAAEQVRKVEALQQYLENELSALRKQIHELTTDKVYETPSDTLQKTTEWTRNTKILNSKVNEYEDRIAALERTGVPKGPKIEELMVEEESVVRLKETVKTLEGRVKMFHDLPPDIQRSKAEYERLDNELQQLVQQRDRMFEGLVDNRRR